MFTLTSNSQHQDFLNVDSRIPNAINYSPLANVAGKDESHVYILGPAPTNSLQSVNRKPFIKMSKQKIHCLRLRAESQNACILVIYIC